MLFTKLWNYYSKAYRKENREQDWNEIKITISTQNFKTK